MFKCFNLSLITGRKKKQKKLSVLFFLETLRWHSFQLTKYLSIYVIDASISQRNDMPTGITELRTKTNYRNGKNGKKTRTTCPQNNATETDTEQERLGEEVPFTKKDQKKMLD